MSTRITVEDYEAAERDLLLARARTVWRLHAITFAVAVALTALAEVRWGGTSWLVYFVLAVWAAVVGIHYQGWVHHGDERIREQQGRIEWRAGRASEHLAPRR